MALSAEHVGGLNTAIVTPLDVDGEVDLEVLRTLVRFQLDNGAAGIVPIGGTGEYPALSRQERAAIVETCVEAAEGKSVIPGVLSTGFKDAVEAGRDFAAAGATAVIMVTPYYATGTQEGIRQYFSAYRNEVDVPVLLYQIPRRTNVTVTPEGIQAMAEDGSIIGMKFCSYDIPEFIKTVKLVGDRIAILSGEEPLFATHVALGAKGGVLASASVYPKIWLQIFALAQEGKLDEALGIQDSVDAVLDVIFLETNPGPLKKYMELVGMPVGGVRLPLQAPGGATMDRLAAVAKHAKTVGLA